WRRSAREPGETRAHSSFGQATAGRAAVVARPRLSERPDLADPGVPRSLLVFDTVEDARDRVLERVVVLEVARVLVGSDRDGLGTRAEDLTGGSVVEVLVRRVGQRRVLVRLELAREGARVGERLDLLLG